MIDEATLSERLHALDVTVPIDLAARAARRGRRRRRLGIGATAVGVVAIVAAVGSVSLIGDRGGTQRQIFAAGVAPVAGPTTCVRGHLDHVPTSSDAGGYTDAHGRHSLTLPSTKDDPGLEAVCLPHPAPGFPIDRGSDSTFAFGGYDKGELTRLFLLAHTPGRITNGGNGSSPTGPEASVIVSRTGTFKTTPKAVAKAKVYPVIGTTTVNGVPATVVRADTHQIGVLVQLGGFDIQAYGSNVTGGPDVTVAQLTVLIASLRNLG